MNQSGNRTCPRLLAVFAAALASALAIGEVFAAQFTQTNITSGSPPTANGTSFGTGAMNNGEPNDGGFFYTPPSGPPPTNPPASVSFNVEICCNAAAYDPRCVEYSGSYKVKDANGVASPAQAIPAGNSCNPCEECIIIPLSAPVSGSSSVFTHSALLPPSSIVVSITANCKKCNSNPQVQGSVGTGTDTMEDLIHLPPPE